MAEDLKRVKEFWQADRAAVLWQGVTQAKAEYPVGPAHCTGGARYPTARPHRGTREGSSARPREPDPRGSVAGRAGPGSAARARSARPAAAMGPALALARPHRGDCQDIAPAPSFSRRALIELPWQ